MKSKANRFRRHTGILVVAALVIVIGIAIGSILLLSAKHPAAKQSMNISKTVATVSSNHQLSPCTTGKSQNIGNASYLVGVDIAPGSYNVVAHKTSDLSSWAEINVFNSKSEYDTLGHPSNDDDKGDQHFSAFDDDSQGTVTKLTSGQYMVVSGDPTTFTCE